ncbi:hypothetical protein [Reyranella sp.]|jgi:hypothetical protein|uniref:hypothetical protein n=1 Tax=Reyranella sp. TaxID=1929291 RepID=UPI003BA913FF
MNILVSDTSVLIDLERGGFLDSCFQLPIQLVVPDLLYARELADFGGPELIKHGLVVEELTAGELAIAQEVRNGHPKLSLPDAFAYSLASARGWVLLSGDGELRALAQANKIPYFGVLWVLDQFFDGKVVEAATLATGLQAIADHPRCRLPRAEITIRLERYQKTD